MAGRPRIKFDLKEVEKLGALHATQEELASFFECSLSIIEKRMAKDTEFLRAFKKGQAKGRLSLRRKQMKLAEKNATMGIWLGKQLLGQRDDFYDNENELEGFKIELEVKRKPAVKVQDIYERKDEKTG